MIAPIRLTDEQVLALGLLVDADLAGVPASTSTSARPPALNGVTANSLRRRGLAAKSRPHGGRIRYYRTDEGIAAWHALPASRRDNIAHLLTNQPTTQENPPVPSTTPDTAPTTGAAWRGAQVLTVHVSRLWPGPDVRTPGGPADQVDELAASIVEHGILEPLLVRRPQAGDTIAGTELDETPPVPEGPDADLAALVVVAGRRRLAAAKAAGLDEVPCLLREDLAGDDGLAVTLVENLQRADLSPVEEARGYDLLRALGYKQTEIAARVGVNQGTVSKRLALLNLLPEAVELVEAGALPVADAVEVAKAPAEVANRVTRRLLDADAAGRKVNVSGILAQETAAAELAKAKLALVDEAQAAGWPVIAEARLARVDGDAVPLAAALAADAEAVPDDAAGFHTLDDGTAVVDQDGTGWNHARSAPMVATDHAERWPACHAVTVVTVHRFEAGTNVERPYLVHVCTDPAAHGWRAPADEKAAAKDAQAKAAEKDAKRRERDRALGAAAHEARLSACRIALKADPRACAVAAAEAQVADLLELGEVPGFGYEKDDLGLLLDVLGRPRPVDTDDPWHATRTAVSDAATSTPAGRLALAMILAAGEATFTLWSNGAAGEAWQTLDPHAPAQHRHVRRLVALGEYQPTKDEAKALAAAEKAAQAAQEARARMEAEAAAAGQPAEPMPDEVPAGALAWYHGHDDDEARWVHDADELSAMLGALAEDDDVTDPAALFTEVTAVDVDDAAEGLDAAELDDVDAPAVDDLGPAELDEAPYVESYPDGVPIDVLVDAGALPPTALCPGSGELALIPADAHPNPGKPQAAGGITHCAECSATMRADEDGNVPGHLELAACAGTGQAVLDPDAVMAGGRVACPVCAGHVALDDNAEVVRHAATPNAYVLDVDDLNALAAEVEAAEAQAEADAAGTDLEPPPGPPLTGDEYQGDQDPDDELDDADAAHRALYADALASIRDTLDAAEADPETFAADVDLDQLAHRATLAATITHLPRPAEGAELDQLLEVLIGAAEALAARLERIDADAAQAGAELGDPPAPPATSEATTAAAEDTEPCPGGGQIVTGPDGEPMATAVAACPECSRSVRTTAKGRVRPHKRPAE